MSSYLTLTDCTTAFGWAAGDVSLAAYIQGTLARMESTDKDVSALGAVMAFVSCSPSFAVSGDLIECPQLYVTYIVLYAVLSAVLGTWVDNYLKAGHSARDALKYVGGVQFTVLCVIMLISTCVPVGSLKFNPKTIDGINTNQDDVERATEEFPVGKASTSASSQEKESQEEIQAQQLPQK
jgi:hypothetical protein